MELVKYFLRNNQIHSLTPSGFLKEYREKFILVNEDNRLLGLSLEQDEDLINQIPKLLFEKMNVDRLNAVTDSDVSIYNIGSSYYSSNYIMTDSNGEKELKINLLVGPNGKIINNDKKFYEWFLNSQLSQEDKTLDINYICSEYGFLEYAQINLHDSKIIIRDAHLIQPTRRLIDTHNEEINTRNIKFKQLKMEGF